MRKLAILLISFFLIASCTGGKTDRTVTLRLKKNLEFAIDGNVQKVCGWQVFSDYGRSDYLAYVNSTKKQLELRNITGGSDLTVPLQHLDSLFGINELSDFYVRNTDSFFFFFPQRRIVLLNKQGAAKREWQINDSLPHVGKSYEISGGFPFRPLLTGNRLFVPIYPTRPEPWVKAEQKEYYSCPAEIVFDLVQNKCLAQVGDFPAEFFEGNYFYEYGPAKCEGPNGEVIYSFGTNDSVFRYDAMFHKTTFPMQAEGMKRQQPFPKDSLYSPYYIRSYYMQQSFYKQITCNKEHALFFRAVLGDTIAENEDGTYNRYKPYRIIISDTAFKKIGEQQLDCTTYADGIFFSGSSGLYIGRYSERLPGKRDSVKLSLFEIMDSLK